MKIEELEYKPVFLSNMPERETNRLGIILNLIVLHSNGIYITRLLKLLYLIDETSIKEIGVPATILEYNVAKNGPLAVDLWSDLKTVNSFNNYVKVDCIEDEDNEKFY
ncbi:MAG TPA: type II toxin-antitoxin system antitoxin SocA domain-containing protein, partial [Nitrosopumilaceae archaeon]|nr:type II toxin-antitoxin system antitoxin SocA domain-containing protein [Nitrosopumilaceae archaeon]